MTLFLLSTMENLREDLRTDLQEHIAKRGNKVAYVSSIPQAEDKEYYYATIRDYQAVSPYIDVEYFDLSESFSDEDLASLVQYGTIYLAGGNTFSFMDMARKRNLHTLLSAHLDNDGLIIGASSGAIMMTPSIEIATLADENTVGIEDLSGFGYVGFDFHPHFSDLDVEQQKLLTTFSIEKQRELYACRDGDGMRFAFNEPTFFGEIKQIGFQG